MFSQFYLAVMPAEATEPFSLLNAAELPEKNRASFLFAVGKR